MTMTQTPAVTTIRDLFHTRARIKMQINNSGNSVATVASMALFLQRCRSGAQSLP